MSKLQSVERACAVLLGVALLAITGPVLGQGTPFGGSVGLTLTPSTTTPLPGSDFTVDLKVDLTTATGTCSGPTTVPMTLGAYVVGVTYDNTKLQYVSVASCGVAQFPNPLCADGGAVVNCNDTNTGNTNQPQGNVCVARMTFRYIATSGSATLGTLHTPTPRGISSNLISGCGASPGSYPSASVTDGTSASMSPSTPTAANSGPICSGSALNLTTPTVTGATYSWTGPSSFSSAVQNPTIAAATTAASGTYSVTTTVNGITSAAGTTTATVNATPATPTAANNGPICAGAALNLTTPTVAGATYAWTGPNSFSSAVQNPTIAAATTAASGTYSVTVTVGLCTSAAGTTTATVNATPATPTAANNGPICAGAALNLTTPTVAGATYAWTGPNSFSSAVQNPTIAAATTAASGTYSVTVTVGLCTSAAGTTTAAVNAVPATPTAANNGPICAGAALNLTTPTVAGAAYAWTGPNSFSSAVQNPTIAAATTAATGTYSVTVTVSGCTSAAGTTTATVNAIPATPTAANNGPICAGSALNLTTPTVAGATYAWTGPNSFSSAVQNPTIAAATTAATGTYSVTVTVSGCTSAAGTTTATVNAIPATPTAANNGPICAGSTLNLTTPLVAGATYAWTGPNTFSSAVQNPSIAAATTAATGTYSVTVTVSGCTSAAGTTTAAVNAVPATPTAANNGPICAGSTLNLTTPTVAGATYAWTGPNSFSSAVQNPTIAAATTAATGTYSVTVTVSGCTSAAGTTTATVNAIPATPTAANNGPICAGSTLNLTTPTVAGATYAWTGPNSFSSAVQNPTIAAATTAATGTYSVTVTVSGCTSAAGTTTATVNAIPATPTAANNGPICAGSTLNLTTPLVAGATYAWTGPNTFSSAVQNPSIAAATTAATGTYSVTVTVSGCTSAAGTTTATVNAIPATPTAANNGPICAGSTLNLTTPLVAGATYAWTGPNTFSSAVQNPSIANATTAATGTYSVTVTVSGCTSAAGTTTATVNAIPATPTVANGGPICAGSTLTLTTPTVAGATYAWTGPNTFSSAVQNPSIANATTAATGTYSVTVTVSGCTSAAGTTTATVNAIPATPTAANNGPICAGATLNLTTPTVAGATYSWTGPNSFVSATQNPAIASATAAASGTYSVTVTVSGCTSSAGTTSATVNVDTTAPTVTAPSSIVENQTICCGTWGGVTPAGSATLNAFVVGGSATDDCTSSPTRLAAQVSGSDVVSGTCFESGATTVTFRFQDAAGHTGTATSTVTVRMYGDLNADGVLDPTDLVVMRAYFNFVLSPGTPPFNAPLAMADLDHSSIVDPSDFVVMRNYANFVVTCLAP